MNKKIGCLLAVLGLLFACLMILTACGTPKLSTPVGLYLDVDTQTLSWQKVKGAAGYSVEVDGKAITTKQNTYVLAGLAEGEYVIKIKAIAGNEEHQDSDVVEYLFVRERESGLVYKLINNNTAYELVSVGSATGDIVMENVYREKPVVSIAKGAFRRCARMTSLVVGENVTSIGESAFYACTELVSITLPKGLKTIGNNAFQNCEKLESIVIPDGITTIAEYTFSLCKALKSVTFGKGVTTIGEYAFADCGALATVTLNDAVTSIGEFAFSGCAALSNVQFNAELLEICQYAFYRCTALQTVKFGEKLKVIGEGAFYESGLTALSIPNSVTTISTKAFAECLNLATITLGNGLEQIGRYAFFNTKAYTEAGALLRIGNWAIVCKEKLSAIPDVESLVGVADFCFQNQDSLGIVKLTRVKYVGENAFASCDSLNEVQFGASLVKIGANAFGACKALDRVRLSEGVKTIDNYAFYQCELLQSSGINLPDSITRIGQDAFTDTMTYTLENSETVYFGKWLVAFKGPAKNLVLKEDIDLVGIADSVFRYSQKKGNEVHGVLSIPDTVKYIGRSAFYKQENLTMVNLPKQLKTIGDYAFYGCKNTMFGGGDNIVDQTRLVIPNGTESIGRSAFYQCQLIIDTKIPGSVKTIGDYAFFQCWYLGGVIQMDGEKPGETVEVYNKLELNEGLESIGAYAFYNCTVYGEMKLPTTVKTLGVYAFSKCYGMTGIEINDGVTEIPANAFSNCIQLLELKIPSSVKHICEYAFRSCKALTKIIIPEGVEQIDTYAFYGCESARQLQLPGTLHTVGDYAFRGLKKLTAVMIPKELVNLSQHAFYGNEATIFMEAESVPATWSARWNSSYRPVILGVTLSDDHSYVVSITKNSEEILNLSQRVSLSKPTRVGYTFLGWATSASASIAEYAADTVVNAPNGTVLYSLWAEGEEPEEEPEEENADQSGDTQNGTGDATN